MDKLLSKHFLGKYWTRFASMVQSHCGQCGYILSRNAMNIISNEYTSVSDIHKSHIYEDTMIALILRKHHIFPKKINKIIVGDK